MDFQTTDSSLTLLADASGVSDCDKIDREDRSEAGQFFSPIETANYLAELFSDESFGDEVVLHDPGAGTGVLTAAFVDSLVKRIRGEKIQKPRKVTLIAGERDELFISSLESVLIACQEKLYIEEIETEICLLEGDWIERSADALENSLLITSEISKATHCILNPPYKKLTSTSKQRQLLKRIGIETTNLYSAFVWLAMRHLKTNGELSAITPRSFCNGPYFRAFREEILISMEVKLLHLLESRTEAFQRDKVLQENIIYHLKKTRDKDVNEGYKVNLIQGGYNDSKLKSVPLEDVVHPGDPQIFFHFVFNNKDKKSRNFVMEQKATLSDLNLCVSTGPVVDYRQKEDLRNTQNKDTYPLIYPHLLQKGIVVRPPNSSKDLPNIRQQKKPVGIVSSKSSKRFLTKSGCYVLVKRFSSKEEKRRVVAAVIYPEDFIEEKIGIENHINYFHLKGEGLPVDFAEGLASYLNSEEVDQYFRQFNGHTQVNATDLRSFKYPTAIELKKLAKNHVSTSS